MDSLKDNELIINLSRGDHDAFRVLFDNYFPRVRFFIWGLVKDDGTAEDLSQDIFAKLWMCREQLPEIKSLNGYIYRMARNAALNHLRRAVCKTGISGMDISDSDTSETLSEQEYYMHEKELLIRLTVEGMPAQRRRIFEMSRYEGMSNSQIADRLNLKEKTVKNHLNLALRQLRHAILSLSILLM